MRGAGGRAVVVAGRGVTIGRAGAVTALTRGGTVDPGLALDPGVTVPNVRGRGTVADVTTDFETALGRLNIGSSKSSSSTISPIQVR